MDLRTWIRAEHEQLDFHYKITAGLVPRDRWAERPFPGVNPVSFIVWHNARSEDLVVNLILRGQRTVYEDGWATKLGVGSAPGTGFSPDDVDMLAATLEPDELDAYFTEVQSRTAARLTSVPDADLDRTLEQVVDVDGAYAKAKDVLPDAAGWVKDFQRGQKGEFFLRWVVIGHAEWHFGELQTVTTALGYPVG